MSFASFAELLAYRARQHPHQSAFRFLSSETEPQQTLTYSQLDARATQIARHLRERAEPGSGALLLFPAGLGFIEALFGCLYAGIVAIPLHPPLGTQMLGRLQDIALDARPTLGLTTDAMLQRIRRHLDRLPALSKLEWSTLENMDEVSAEQALALPMTEVAMLQYTSGSTGSPKGVILTNTNLIKSASQVHVAFGSPKHPDDRMVCWLPLFHDMGMMSGVLGPIFSCIESVIMSPAAFAQRPVRWLEAIGRFKATLSGAPNFGYDQCVSRISDEERHRLELSSWQVAFCGAEPIRDETLRNFESAFAMCGFKRQAFLPCYGLAEATVAVTASREFEPIVVTLSAESLQGGDIVEAASCGQPLVACGRPVTDVQVLIVDPERRCLLSPDRIGEVWVRGPNVALGYWRQPERTREVFGAVLTDTGEGPFLRTGDLGFIRDGRLFVTGRAKDLIVIRGLNYYPQDIETSAEQSHDTVVTGGAVAFGVDAGAGERLVVVQEVRRTARDGVSGICDMVRAAIARDHAIVPFAIVLVRQGQLPKTPTGKIQRDLSRSMLLRGDFKILDAWSVEPASFLLKESEATGIPEPNN